MVTLITEKLRNQTLDDEQFEPIPQVARRSWELTTPALSAFNFNANSDKKDWTLSLSSSDSWNPGQLRAAVAAAQGGRLHGELTYLRNLPPDVLHDTSPHTPPAPPKKRHCRSLSIPGDGKLGKQWQPQASSIWRPVAVRTAHNSKMKRNSPHCLHKSRVGCSSSPLSTLATTSCHSPRAGRWSVTSSEYITPPESPIPRPASASSGFYDSSQGSLNAAWLDASPTPAHDAAPARCLHAFKVRSLSVEEAISSGAGMLPGHGAGAGSGSMPAIPHLPSSTPSSPQRQRVPRSRSQPCVLHDRKCGLKRRRDEERPRLNLLKMSETAYERRVLGSSKIRGIQCAIPSYTDPPECFLGLNTIASSPLDGTSSHMSSTQTLTVVTPNASPEREKVLRIDIQAADSLSLRTPGDRLSDSGCSENELSELSPVAFVDSEDNSCSCSDSRDCSCHEADDNEEEQVFELEMNNDLDLEQIEKD